MNAWRHYEILLPLRFNDGQRVPDDTIGEVLLELEKRFGAVTWETQIVRGRWRNESQVFEDDSMRVIVDVPDLPENREYFRQFKEHLKVCFQQIDIWMTTHTIDIV